MLPISPVSAPISAPVSPEAFALRLRKLRPPLRGAICSAYKFLARESCPEETAEEILAEAELRALKSLSRYDDRFGDAGLFRWMERISKRATSAYLQRIAREREGIPRLSQIEESRRRDPNKDPLAFSHRRIAVEQAARCAGLTPGERKVLRLLLAGMEMEEISARMELDGRTCANYRAAAVRKIRRELTEPAG